MKRLIILLLAGSLATSRHGQHARARARLGAAMRCPAKCSRSPPPKKDRRRRQRRSGATKGGGESEAEKSREARPVAKSRSEAACEQRPGSSHAKPMADAACRRTDADHACRRGHHAGHAMPHARHAGDLHAARGIAHELPAPPVAPPPPGALSGPQNAADTVWGGGR